GAVRAIDRLRRLYVIPGEETATASGSTSVAQARPPRDRRVECLTTTHDIGRERDDEVLGIEAEILANTQACVVREFERHRCRLLRRVNASTRVARHASEASSTTSENGLG